jgi:hypothetical protein
MINVQSKQITTDFLWWRYQKVEYIQSSWTQYFSVWSQFKTSYKVVIDFQMTQIWWDYIPVWIHYHDGWSNNIKYWLDAYNWYFMVNAWWSWTQTKTEDKNRHTITINKSAVTVDGSSYTTNYVNYTYSQWIWVFAYNEYHNTSPWNYKSSNKLYKLDIYNENWTHIHDLVPCYRKSDSVIWMLDTVNKVFYTNQWSWSFTKWPNV